MLTLVGYWRGDEEAEEWWDPRLFVRAEWEIQAKSEIVTYLRAGVRVHEDLGYSYCRFPDGPPDEEMGNAELTDGVLLWPEGLWIYVARYSVILPSNFVEHMRRHRFTIAATLDDENLDSIPVDLCFWRSWCSQTVPSRE